MLTIFCLLEPSACRYRESWPNRLISLPIASQSDLAIAASTPINSDNTAALLNVEVSPLANCICRVAAKAVIAKISGQSRGVTWV